jgi:ABC-type Co2+ transport system permease subunit
VGASLFLLILFYSKRKRKRNKRTQRKKPLTSSTSFLFFVFFSLQNSVEPFSGSTTMSVSFFTASHFLLFFCPPSPPS